MRLISEGYFSKDRKCPVGLVLMFVWLAGSLQVSQGGYVDKTNCFLLQAASAFMHCDFGQTFVTVNFMSHI